VLDWLQSVPAFRLILLLRLGPVGKLSLTVLIDGLLPSSRADIATEGYA